MNKDKNFETILSEYKKNHSGEYRNYPCPKCGSPILVNWDCKSYNGMLGYTDTCTNKNCNFSWSDYASVL